MANRSFIVYTLDLLSIPEYVIKKGRPHGHRYGKLPENKEYHQAHHLNKRCIKRQFKGIHDRFLRDHVFRERMIENKRDEHVCRAWDVLAEQDYTYRMSEAEYFHYRQHWWISLNKSGNNTQPVRKRSDFNQALSTLNCLHQEAGGQQLRPMPHWKLQRTETGIEFFLYLVAMARILVVFLRIQRKSRKRGCKQRFAIERCNPLFTELWRKLQTNGSRIHSIMLQIVRLQLTAVYCSRRGVQRQHLKWPVFAM